MQLSKAKVRFGSDIDNSADKDKKVTRVSAFTEDFKKEYYNISVDKLIPFRNQARRHFDDESIKALSLTIKEHGIRQPLTIIPSEKNEGLYEIVSGERRFRAAKLIGLSVVPCIIIHDQKKAEEIALIENIQRKNLHPVELMYAFDNLLLHKVCENMKALAEKIGVKQSYVSEILSLKQLPIEVQDTLIQNKIKSRHLFRKLISSSPSEYDRLIEAYKNKKNVTAPELKLTKRKPYGLRSKSTVVSILLVNGEFKINKNKISKLTDEQKNALKPVVESLIVN
jgi:ParB family chromosome partitioning protein